MRKVSGQVRGWTAGRAAMAAKAARAVLAATRRVAARLAMAAMALMVPIALLAIGPAGWAVVACGQRPPEVGGDPLASLRAPRESRAFDLAFWAQQERDQTRVWREAVTFCRGRAEQLFPNCGSVRRAAWWGAPPPPPAPPPLLPAPVTRGERTEAGAERAERADDGASAGAAECERCAGRGWVVAADGGNGRARRCGCGGERPLAERLAAAGVWEEYLHCSRESWRGEWPAARLAEFGVRRHLCTIFGAVGSGKTHLATAILGEWLRAGGRGVWREASTALEEIKRAIAGGGADELVRSLKSARHLLVLDDVLTQQGTDWTEFLLSHVLRYRQGRHLPTVVTANVTDLVDLDQIEPRLSSRCGAGIVIGLAGGDRRTARGAGGLR